MPSPSAETPRPLTTLKPRRTARETYAGLLGAERAEAVPLAALGLLREADLDKPVGRLSVGQRRRLALALLVARPPQLLLLDEPTNHLSPRLCAELEAALATSPGATVLASHDRRLRRRWTGRELRLTAGGAVSDRDATTATDTDRTRTGTRLEQS